eukprot:TRINITY_DN1026_c0_g1_i16.p1 TRINITY_DN1026_c0_g1~~TRINITY_DN1026_c0_g1_i16.p1  ORF type:complete len:371 (+),score=74.89 TRINITY_DN1026_c0_g1_i16:60-1115(+)
MATFPIYIRHFDGSQRAFDITLTDTVKDVKEMMEEGDMFDLIYAGAELDDKQTLEPNMELEMVVDRQKLAESRADEIFDYEGSSFWEYGGATTESERGYVEMEFPPPTDININMMPFVFGDKNSIPSEYHGYLPLIENCWNLRPGKICYLTIQESLVKKDTSQRRAGLHIETPGSFENLHPKHRLGGGENRRVDWGGDVMEYSCDGGIYMSSTVSDSCRVFNCRIREDKLTEPGIVRSHGDVSHLEPEIKLACERRKKLSAYADNHVINMKPKRLYWITDRTPHESLPLAEDTYRQYFRVVSPSISVWFADHSTANPLGIVPPSDVIILEGNKFESDGSHHSEPGVTPSRG